jgi:carbonic anhydrase
LNLILLLGTYASPCGPKYWYKGYPDCALTQQSPINFGGLTKLRSNGEKPTLHVNEDGCKDYIVSTDKHHIKVTMNCANMWVMYNGVKYTLLQMHFHSPSEHTIGYGVYAAELHMVHRSAAGNYLVMGVFLDEGPTVIDYDNKFINFMEKQLGAGITTPTHVLVEDGKKLNPYDQLTPPDRAMFHYRGSFTNPPCHEGVRWFMYQQPVKISANDLTFLRSSKNIELNSLSAAGNSNRPVQDLNDRFVYFMK